MAARPQFDAVSGVSTGAMIAPFAFLGDDESIDRIVQMYRHPPDRLGGVARAAFLLAEQSVILRSAGSSARNDQGDGSQYG
jgi:hypothetical protein